MAVKSFGIVAAVLVGLSAGAVWQVVDRRDVADRLSWLGRRRWWWG